MLSTVTTASATPTMRRTTATVLLNALKPFLAPQVAAVLEHITRLGMQSPVAAFSGPVGTPRYLDEAVIEA